jgi:hypothetical protein
MYDTERGCYLFLSHCTLLIKERKGINSANEKRRIKHRMDECIIKLINTIVKRAQKLEPKFVIENKKRPTKRGENRTCEICACNYL